MYIRLTVLSLLTLAYAQPLLAQQEPAPAYPPAYPPGTYQPQPAPYPQQQPGAFPQQQPMDQQQGYPPGAYPSPLAADPNAQYAPGGYPPGYVYGQQPAPLAQAPQEQLLTSVEGALQLSMGTYFMRYTSSSFDYDSEMISDESVSDLLWGLSEASTITLEGAYGITDRLLVGGILQLGGTSGSRDPDVGEEAEASSFDLLIGPKAEFHFLPTSKFNPYAGGALAIASHSDDLYSRLMFNLQIRAGVRCFLTDSLSIDPALVFAFGFGGGELDVSGFKSDYSLSGFRIGLALNVSGWLR